MSVDGSSSSSSSDDSSSSSSSSSCGSNSNNNSNNSNNSNKSNKSNNSNNSNSDDKQKATCDFAEEQKPVEAPPREQSPQAEQDEPAVQRSSKQDVADMSEPWT